MTVSFVNSTLSNRFSPSSFCTPNSTSLTSTCMQMQAAIWVPPVTAAVSCLATSLLSSNLFSDGITSTKAKVAELSNQILSAVGRIFSYFYSSTNAEESQPVQSSIPMSCALGALSLGSGQLPLQLAGIGLLADCLKFPGVEARSPNQTFITTAKLKGDFTPWGVLQTQDGGYILGGHANTSLGFGGLDEFLTKFALNGTEEWTTIFGGTAWEAGYSIAETIDGYSIGGYTEAIGIGRVLLSKIFPNGTLNETKIFGATLHNEGAYAFHQLPNLDLIWTGFEDSSGSLDVLLTRTTAEGIPIWTIASGGAGADIGRALTLTRDGGSAVAGYTQSVIAGVWSLLLEKFTSIGGFSWAKVLSDGLRQCLGVALKETQDQSLAVAGYIRNASTGKSNGLLTKFNSSGNFFWAIAFGGTNDAQAFDLEETLDGGLLVIGSVTGFSAGTGLIAKFNPDGSLSWASVLKGNYTGYCMKKTSGGGFALSGTLINPETQESEIFLAQLDANGRIPNCDAMEFINLPVTNLTGLVTITPFSPNTTIVSPTVSSWTPSSTSQRMNQTLLCDKTNSLTPSTDQSRSSSRSAQRTSSESSSFSTISQSQSLIGSSSYSPFHTRSGSLSMHPSVSHSSLASRTDSGKLTRSLSEERLRTRTRQRTKTHLLRDSTSVIIQQFNLPLSGILHTQLSPSGSLVLTQTSTGFELITVSSQDTLTPAGSFTTTGTAQATTFSKDEQYVFVADDQGNIQVIDIRNPNIPKFIGFVPTGSSIKSLSISGDGTQLLIGTNTGIQVLSAKTPASTATMTPVTSYATASPVISIQTDPNTNTVVAGFGNNVTLLDLTNNRFTRLDQKTFPQSVKTISPTDLTDPTQLTLTLVNGDTIFMNIANPKSSVITSNISSTTSTELTTVSGGTVLVAGVKPGIQIFQGAREVGYSPVTDSVTSLAFASDGRFAIYSDSEGLKLIKVIKDPGRLDVPLPRLLDIVKLGFPISDVLLNEEGNWIAVGGNRLTFISLDNLQLPTILGNVNTTGTIQQMVFFPDKTKLLLVDGNGVACVNCFNPQAPAILGRWNNAETIYGLTLSGSHAYACQGEKGISVLDITNPLKMIETTSLPTQGSAQSILFNQAKTLAYVADSSGIDIWKVLDPVTFQRINRINATGFVSDIALSSDEKTLYVASEQTLRQFNVSDTSNPSLSNLLDTTYPIQNIVLSNQGKAAYVAVDISGVLVVDTSVMQTKGSLPCTSAQALVLNEYEDQIYVADMDGGLKVAELVTDLPIIPLTARTSYPVGISVVEPLLFFNQTLEPVKIDRINSIRYINMGQTEDLPLWLSADLTQQKLFVTAPKELTGQTIQLAISFDVNGVTQQTVYQTQIVSSLEMNTEKGSVSFTTPSPSIAVDVNLTGGSFIPLVQGAVSASTQDNLLQVFGSVSDINNYLESVRINPNPITLGYSAVALNPAQIRATDLINLFPTNGVARLRNFRFNQAPIVTNPMNQTNKKALDSFEITVPSNTFTDPDDPKLTLSAQLVNGSSLPSWLTFNPVTATFDGLAPASMLNQTLQITITASDGYLSANSTWELHFNANRGPFVASSIPSLTRVTSNEFSYTIPAAVFQDLDNNTLTYSAVQDGYDILPGFLSFDPNTLTFLGRPTPDDVNTYTIKLTATDQFGASAVALMDLDIRFSNWDAFLNGFEKFGIASAAVTPFTWAYYQRAFIRNSIKRRSYWRNEIPTDLLEGRGYKPKHPTTEKEIEKDDIVKIQVMALDKEKWGYDFAKDKLPIPFYVSLCAKPLLNNEPLPAWLSLDPDAGTLTLKQEHFPHESKRYIFQVLGEQGYILESFFIDPARISAYQAPINLSDIVSRDLDAMELLPQPAGTKPSAQADSIPNVWAEIDDIEGLADQRPGTEANRTVSTDIDSLPVEQSIDVNLLFDDDTDPIPSQITHSDHKTSSTNAPTKKEKWVMPQGTRELEEALSQKL